MVVAWNGRSGGRTITDAMGELVPAEITIASEDLFALVALVRFVIRMRQQMRLEVGALVKAATTYGTLVRRLFHVEDLVHGQRARLTKAFAAFAALERLLFGVYISVVT